MKTPVNRENSVKIIPSPLIQKLNIGESISIQAPKKLTLMEKVALMQANVDKKKEMEKK